MQISIQFNEKVKYAMNKFASLAHCEFLSIKYFSDEEQCANSLTRKVTKRIMSNVSNIKANIDNGEIEDNGKRKKLMTAESFSIID